MASRSMHSEKTPADDSLTMLKTNDNNKLDVFHMMDQLVAEGYLAEDRATLMRNIIRPADVEAQGAIVLLADKRLPLLKPLPNTAMPSQALIDLAFLSHWLAVKSELPFETIDPLKIDVPAVTKTMSYAYAERYGILPVAVDANTITVATIEPFDDRWHAEIARINNREISLVILNPDDIKRYQVEFYKLAKSVQGARDYHAGNQASAAIQNLEQLTDLSKNSLGKSDLDANDQHVVSIVDWLMQYAFDQRASDIHLEPRRDIGNVRFRIDGVLHSVYEMPPPVMTAVSSRLKILGRMDVAEKRRPQDGRIKTRDGQGLEVELRLSTMPTAFGEKLVMRIFDPEVTAKSYEQLGFSQHDAALWQSMITKPHGIILVTGPTGSGKTTTLYASLKQLAKPEVNVCTVEDPIENVEPAFNQMQVQTNIGLTFAAGVRTLLRQDPDIVMVGEIRDIETAQMAIQASLTGHLVLSTLHTNDAASAITRLIEIGVAPYLINATLLGVVAQRLVRTLCPNCKRPVEYDEARWQELVRPFTTSKPKHVHEARGCLECRQTGFKGRMAIHEVFTMSPGIKALNQQNVDINELRHQAIKEGMRPLRLAGAQKVAAGLSSIEEVLKVAPAVASFESN